MNRKKILFVFPNESSFVKKDIEMLSENYNVFTYTFYASDKLLIPIIFIHQFFFLLFNTSKFSIVISQLAAYHSFLPMLFARIFNKPSLIFLGGTDCAKFPSINYGNFNKPLLGLFTAWSVKLAKHLAPKHESLIYFDYQYAEKDYPAQGIKCFVKNFNTPYTVIHNGYDAGKFKCISEKKKNTFLTVAAGIGIPNTVPLKGIDLILAVAASFPDCTFTIAGAPKKHGLNIQTSNVTILPELPNDDLIKLYSEHEYYLQLSMSEGFPNAICEAMLCECIPIGSNVNALPAIIADTGYVLKKKNIKLLADVLTHARSCQHNDELGKKARNHIATHFSLEERKKRLNDLIIKICSS